MTREQAIQHGKEQLEIFGGEHREFIKLAIEALEQQPKTVSIDKLKNLIEKLQDEKDYAYANFDEYKLDVLGCDDIDDLPNDDFRFGLCRAIELLQLLIAESEGKNDSN